MNYKIENVLKKGKATIIVAVILWLLLTVVFIMPITCSNYQMQILKEAGKDFDSNLYIQVYSKAASSPRFWV